MLVNKLEILKNINIEIPQKAIFSRLGYNFHKTKISDDYQKKIQDIINFAAALCEISVCYKIFDIISNTDNKITITNNIIFNSKKLSEFLKACDKIVMMAATAGKKIYEEIQKHNKLSEAVILDAVASEMTDAALDWLKNYLVNNFRRNNIIMTDTRYSAGYGDFDISNQKIIYDLLKLEKLGIAITDTFILLPEKSVTAIYGLQTL
ncbi:MAG TPA: vitamin B12 dependent-methionine synthase activation domain-containing protein [bacterium]|nr:vitamin B12 dependent-methionine synthase activation domain-containing protein [bacterium]HPP86722.1 vitamin B12 dependent-methionine synthase activation domain-containing protein [bacterium]